MSLPEVINQVLAVRNDTELLKEAEEKPKKEEALPKPKRLIDII